MVSITSFGRKGIVSLVLTAAAFGFHACTQDKKEATKTPIKTPAVPNATLPPAPTLPPKYDLDSPLRKKLLEAPPAVPIKYTQLLELSNEEQNVINNSISLASNIPPFKNGVFQNNPFHWQGDKSKFSNISKVEILFVDSKTKEIRELVGDHINNTDTDACTVTLTDKTNKKIQILTFLLIDKLFKKNGVPRQDVTTHLSTVIAHEVYGNVQRQMDYVANNIQPTHTNNGITQERIDSEKNAFQTGIDFIDNVLNSGIFSKSAYLLDNFKNKRIEEQELLYYWSTKTPR